MTVLPVAAVQREALGGDDTRWVRAPGRVNLMGDHTDYNDGLVLPMAVDRACVVGWHPVPGDRISARSRELRGIVEIAADGSADPAAVEPPWGRFVAGAVRALAEHGVKAGGVDLSVSSSVPVGSGLSSSAALGVAVVVALITASRDQHQPDCDSLGRREIAAVTQRAEHLATGTPTGLMDQLASLFGRSGHALLVDCRSLAIAPVPLPAHLAVLVVHSGIARALAGSRYAERRSACEKAAARLGVPALRDARLDQVAGDLRARHVVAENARVEATADALRGGDDAALGSLLLASHASLRDDFEVSTPELDTLVELAVEHGALGARLTGAGFGGCIVAFVPRRHVERSALAITSRYREATGLDAQAFGVRAVDGAGPLPARGSP